VVATLQLHDPLAHLLRRHLLLPSNRITFTPDLGRLVESYLLGMRNSGIIYVTSFEN
jgi:hypothetical protein